MPSEALFKKQADLIRETLQTFNSIRVLNAPGPLKAAIIDLVNATVCMSFIFLGRVLNIPFLDCLERIYSFRLSCVVPGTSSCCPCRH
jgi:hypothetical protein